MFEKGESRYYIVKIDRSKALGLLFAFFMSELREINYIEVDWERLSGKKIIQSVPYTVTNFHVHVQYVNMKHHPQYMQTVAAFLWHGWGWLDRGNTKKNMLKLDKTMVFTLCGNLESVRTPWSITLFDLFKAFAYSYINGSSSLKLFFNLFFNIKIFLIHHLK